MGLLSWFLPTESKFFVLFEEVSANLRLAAEQLALFMAKEPGKERDAVVYAIKDLEHNTDVHIHKIFNELHNAFVTPFDREDIHELASSLDDIMDYTTYSVQRVALYKAGKLTRGMVKQIECLISIIASVCDIVENLRDLKNISEISPYLQEVHRLENLGDQAYTEALQELFAGTPDPISVIMWKDIYGLVETAIDRCERSADVAEGIAIKHA